MIVSDCFLSGNILLPKSGHLQTTCDCFCACVFPKKQFVKSTQTWVHPQKAFEEPSLVCGWNEKHQKHIVFFCKGTPIKNTMFQLENNFFGHPPPRIMISPYIYIYIIIKVHGWPRHVSIFPRYVSRVYI